MFASTASLPKIAAAFTLIEQTLAWEAEERLASGGGCRACSGILQEIGAKSAHVRLGRNAWKFQECAGCGALHGECYRGEAHAVISPVLSSGSMEDAKAFDLTVIGSSGVSRWHGFYNPATGAYLQEG